MCLTTGRVLLYHAFLLVQTGQVEQAQPMLREALGIFREHYQMLPELAAWGSNWLGTVELAPILNARP